ncbi:hypothetical protein TNCV_915911 [Trichonephila clavipes]|nr:hypothetical protein TNCV_915911 [Trichonephila clavipes]
MKAVSVLEHFSGHDSIHQKLKKNTASVYSIAQLGRITIHRSAVSTFHQPGFSVTLFFRSDLFLLRRCQILFSISSLVRPVARERNQESGNPPQKELMANIELVKRIAKKRGKNECDLDHTAETTSGCFTRGRIIGKLEEGRSVTSVAAEFVIAHSIVSRLWRQFQTTVTAIRGSVVVVHEEPHPQMTGTLSYRPEETGGRQREKSLDTRHRRLDDRYHVLPWPEDWTVVVCLHDALYGVYL